MEHGKPFPDIYEKACAELGVAPSDAMGIEDSINGVISSAKAGLHTIMVVDLVQPTDETKELAEHVFDSLFEVKELLRHTV